MGSARYDAAAPTATEAATKKCTHKADASEEDRRPVRREAGQPTA
jgi:hypothetical protein